MSDRRSDVLFVLCIFLAIFLLAPFNLEASSITRTESATHRSAMPVPPTAICVPWQADKEFSHATYSGATTRLKGIARGDAIEFRWDFGDGDSTTWATISNPYNLEASHDYTGPVGQVFTATLFVRNASLEVGQDTYKVRIYESSDLSIEAHLQVRVDMSIDEGLWWLHKTLNRSTFPSDEPGYGQPYGYWSDSAGYELGATGAAVDAFQVNGHKVIGVYNVDPYVETVQRAMNFILSETYTYNIVDDPTPAGDPDTNENGIGLVANNEHINRQTYIGGICALALASSGAPDHPAGVGRSFGGVDYVYGRTYAEIVQDMVDFFAFGQTDIGYSGRGGWRYHANYGNSDMSTTQWPPLVMVTAEQEMGTQIPQFVRDELWYFLQQTNHTNCDGNHGGWGYSDPSNHINCTKAGIGLICHEFLETPFDDPLFEGGMGYLYRRWNDSASSWYHQRLLGNSYGMYAVMKAMRVPNPTLERIYEFDCTIMEQTSENFDWFYATDDEPREGLGHYCVRMQQANGSWDDVPGPNPVYNAFCTGWRVLILSEFTARPVAVISNCDKEYKLNQDIWLNGSSSFHIDPDRNIILYEWDFDYDGVIFDVDAWTLEPEVTIEGGFPEEEWYPVALRVTDDAPILQKTDIYDCEIWVHPPPHCPHPYAHPEGTTGEYLGWIGVPVEFDASRSSDPDDFIVSWDWDLDNDGLFGCEDPDCFGEPCDAVGETTTWTWYAPYTGPIGLRVIDDGGEFPPCAKEDYSTIAIGNHNPVSIPCCDELNSCPYKALPDATIILDGSCSYDPDEDYAGDTITFAWDLDFDGYFDDCDEPQCEFTVVHPVGHVYTIRLMVTDNFGLPGIETTTVVVVDNEPPTADANGPYFPECQGVTTTVPLNGTGSSDPQGYDTLMFKWTTDCPGAVFDPDDTSDTPLLTIDSIAPCPMVCNVTLEVTDDYGATDTDSTTVTIQDTTEPSIQCPSNVTVECTESTDPANTGSATATDLCDPSPVITFSETVEAGACPQEWMITRTWTATDSCGNSSSCDQIIIVDDSMAPVITCPADVTVTCGESTDPMDTGVASAVDNCDTTPTIAYTDVEAPAACLADPVMYTITRTWVATDDCGNTSSCDQIITVLKVVRDLDIKPGSCPNSFNRGLEGVLPVSLLGTDTFDVTTVDLNSIRISRVDCGGGSFAPMNGPPGPGMVYEDAGTPYSGIPCDCHELEGDGITDISMKFDIPDMVYALQLWDFVGDDRIPLAITGVDLDGCEFMAVDCIRIVPPNSMGRAVGEPDSVSQAAEEPSTSR